MTNFIFFKGKTLYTSVITMAVGIINLILLVVFVDAWGLEGAGMAYSVSTFLLFVVTFSVATRLESMPWRLE